MRVVRGFFSYSLVVHEPFGEYAKRSWGSIRLVLEVKK